MKGLVAKITPPKADGALLRPRLFSLLDKGRKKRVIWVSGAAGSGKTTLVASYLTQRKLPFLWYQVDQGDADVSTFFYYMGLAAETLSGRKRKALPLLTPEYLQCVPLFARRFFEELYGRIKPPFAIVLDDFQDCNSTGFHEAISRGLETAPDGVNVIVISREISPLQFARLRANSMISFVGWNELSFTVSETESFFRVNGGRRLSRETAVRLHEKTDGWAAGLLLIAESSKAGVYAAQSPQASTPAEIFDYFASVIFGKSDPKTQDFLLKTSFLPAITERSARKITGDSGAGSVLAKLGRSHSFIEWRTLAEPVYQYHPLFREFLLSRAGDVFNADQILKLRSCAAGALAEEGRVEAAAILYKEAGDWEGLIKLILANAQSLVVQGRTRSLQDWIDTVPEDVAETSPGLLYWSGICRIAFDPARARDHFQRAFDRFGATGDLTGIMLSCASIVETFVYEWNDFTPLDYWIRELGRYVRLGRSYPSDEIELKMVLSMAVALMIRRPDHPKIAQWFAALTDLARRSPNEHLMLNAFTWASNYYFWIGDHVRGRSLHKEVRKLGELPQASPLARLTWMWMEAATHIVFDASPGLALDQISKSLRYGRDAGVHLWDHMLFALGVHASLVEDDFATAASFLKMNEEILQSSRRHGYCHFHYLSAWFHLLKGDLTMAGVDADLALDIAEETGFVFPVILCCLLSAQVHHENARDDEADILIARASILCRQTKNMILNYMCALAKANVDLDSGRDKSGVRMLAVAMRLGREKGYTYLPWMYQPAVMSRLCTTALENGIEVEYVRDLIRKYRLVADAERATADSWPWPIKIYSLGEFRIFIDDRRLMFEGKVQQKPLSMLKMLIALGGRDLSEIRMMDSLWPDADGDSAHKSFEMTLLRLRRLLGREDAVILTGAAVSLNPGCCWVDAQAFEHLAGSADKAWKKSSGKSRGGAARAVRLIEKALEMYGGPLLPNDTDMDCTVAMREKTRNSAIQLVGYLGSHWESARQWRKAIECYRKGIEIDRFFEDFYLRLMICQQSLGQRTEAVRTYERCRTVLSSAFGIEPSEKTQALYAVILRSR